MKSVWVRSEGYSPGDLDNQVEGIWGWMELDFVRKCRVGFFWLCLSFEGGVVGQDGREYLDGWRFVEVFAVFGKGRVGG